MKEDDGSGENLAVIRVQFEKVSFSSGADPA
jgi:hypothetical protein